MRYLEIVPLLSEEISIENICVLPIHEPLGFKRIFDQKKRHCNVLCIYNIGKRLYHIQDTGENFTLSAGDILYIPQHSEYNFEITETGDENYDYAIAIDFVMRDKSGENVCFGRYPRILTHDRMNHYYTLFHRLECLGNTVSTNIMFQKSLVYALFYEILCEIRNQASERDPYRLIAPAIDILEHNPAYDCSIPALAKQCGIGETYFRKLFSKYSGGISPTEYRNRLRLDMAEKLLRTEMVTVEYAAMASGFHDLSHFYRLYKKYKGTTPQSKNSVEKASIQAE